MNGKHYIGKRVSSFENYNTVGPITGVALLLDDKNEILAGSETGYVIEIECPYGTQAMANALLTKLQGKTYYGFHADGAELAPEAELGDGVTVGDTYSMLAYRNVNFGPGHLSEISAPGDSELAHEYPYISQEQKKIERQIAAARSLITKTSGEIMLRVEGVEGDYTELKTTLDGVTITDSSGTTRIKGSSIDTGTLAANSISADKLNLTGAITFGDLNAATQQTITAASNNAAAASNNAAAALNVASAASSQISAWSYGGTTYIDGSKLMTGTVMASKLLGGTVGLLASNEMVVGSIDIAYTTTGIGLGINTTYGGIQIQSGGNVFLRAAAGQVLTVGGGYFSFGGGTILLPTACYGNALPSSGNYGQVFFLLS